MSDCKGYGIFPHPGGWLHVAAVHGDSWQVSAPTLDECCERLESRGCVLHSRTDTEAWYTESRGESLNPKLERKLP